MIQSFLTNVIVQSQRPQMLRCLRSIAVSYCIYAFLRENLTMFKRPIKVNSCCLDLIWPEVAGS